MSIAAVVLAAGSSRRMGRDKALLRFGGRTLLEHLCASARQAGLPALAVVGASRLAAVQRNCHLPGCRLLVNPDPDSQTVDSLRLALRELTASEGVVVLLVDQAFVKPQTLVAVADGLERAPAVVARYRGQPGHPVGFRRELFERLLGAEADGGAHLLVDVLRREGSLLEIECDDPGVVRNLNHPEQFARFLAGSSGGEPE